MSVLLPAERAPDRRRGVASVTLFARPTNATRRTDLPRAEAYRTSRDMGAVGIGPDPGTRVGTVLVVDSSPAARQAVGALLGQWGIRAAFAHNVFEAVT